MLVEELQAAGLDDAALDDNGYVMATLPGTVDGDAPVDRAIAHVDTSPDAPGRASSRSCTATTTGGVIELPRDGTVLDPATMPELAGKVGHDIVTASGDTLLGADDKAGVAEIMAAVAHLAAHPELPRPTLRVGFTPDEEIGEGATLFDVERFGAVCAYTIDGSELGELQDETFSGRRGDRRRSTGVDVHPGWAKGKLVNAARLAGESSPRCRPTAHAGDDLRARGLHPPLRDPRLRPAGRRSGRSCATSTTTCSTATSRCCARPPSEVVGRRAARAARGRGSPQYPNMRRFIDALPGVVEVAERAMRAEGIEPLRTPIRGGTDGSRLSEMGLPTPNLFTGGHEYHSVREWASLQEMAAAAATIVRLAEAWAAH